MIDFSTITDDDAGALQTGPDPPGFEHGFAITELQPLVHPRCTF
jgi:hypothetical protein